MKATIVFEIQISSPNMTPMEKEERLKTIVDGLTSQALGFLAVENVCGEDASESGPFDVEYTAKYSLTR